jgi:hypothetical protein
MSAGCWTVTLRRGRQGLGSRFRQRMHIAVSAMAVLEIACVRCRPLYPAHYNRREASRLYQPFRNGIVGSNASESRRSPRSAAQRSGEFSAEVAQKRSARRNSSLSRLAKTSLSPNPPRSPSRDSTQSRSTCLAAISAGVAPRNSVFGVPERIGGHGLPSTRPPACRSGKRAARSR